ncbi:MAG: hypothetical protein ACREUR_08825 [Nitrosospira sp.]
MFKYFTLVVVLGLAHSGHSGKAAAQETGGMEMSMGSVPARIASDMGLGMAQNSPFLSPGSILSPNQYRQGHLPYAPYGRPAGHHAGTPLVVLPMPLPMNGMSGPHSMSGAQFPGSYMPQGTPLHRFNGYTVCDPPDLAEGTTPKRIVKITTTRTPASPSHSQPCPIYTVNGEIHPQKGYATTTTIITPPVQSAPQ